MKIILLGYMGSGKTSVGQEILRQTGIRLIDLDQYIEDHAGKSITDIFSQDGEIHFRKLERKCFVEILEMPNNLILSLGGGTPCYSGNHLLLKGDDRKSFFLRASVGELAKRLRADVTSRPLLDTKMGSDLEEFIAKHLFDRNEFYRFATHTIPVDGKSIQSIAEEIVGLAEIG